MSAETAIQKRPKGLEPGSLDKPALSALQAPLVVILSQLTLFGCRKQCRQEQIDKYTTMIYRC